MISFDAVTKSFSNGQYALEDISFVVDPGEFVFILGPSGSGKTTLLRLILRELSPTAGKILVADQDLSNLPNHEIPHLRRQIGSAFQDFKLIPYKNAYENVILALDILGMSEDKMKQKGAELLERVGLIEKAHLFPSQLSGGEIQRVAIARALALEPVLLFADEPTGNLDQETSSQIIKLLEDIHSHGTTVIMATHDMDLIKNYSHRQLHFKKGHLEKDTHNKSKPTKPKPTDSKTKKEAKKSKGK